MIEAIAKNQDREAFTRLFELYAARIKAYALNASGIRTTPDIAEEVVQESMIKIWNKAAQFDRKKAAVDAWVFTIARNARIDLSRKRRHENTELKAEDLWHENTDPEPMQILRQREIQKTIRQGLANIRPDQAVILNGMYMEGKTQQEIANENDVPLGTIKSRTRRAMRHLRIILSEEES